MQILLLHTLNGLSLGMVVFMLSCGFTLIFGLMRITNLAQGSYYLLGAYIGLTVLRETGNFTLAVLAGSVTMGVLGFLMCKYVLLRFVGPTMEDALLQVLLTFGFLIAFSDIALWVWGGTPQLLSTPSWLQGPLKLGDFFFPKFRLFIVVVGLMLAGVLFLFQEKTHYGLLIRAAADDEEMARVIRINVPRLFSWVFGLGALLAGFSGVVGGAFLGVYVGVDFYLILLVFIVVIVGGLGSLKGTFVASIFIGIIDNFAKALIPEAAMFSLFAAMAIVLVLRPRGLFGEA